MVTPVDNLTYFTSKLFRYARLVGQIRGLLMIAATPNEAVQRIAAALDDFEAQERDAAEHEDREAFAAVALDEVARHAES